MSQSHPGSAAGSARSTRERVGCETVGTVRGVPVDGNAGDAHVPASAQCEGDPTRLGEAAPRVEGVGAAGTTGRVDGV